MKEINYPLVKKAYYVGHKDRIKTDEYNPEPECSIIHADNRNQAILKYWRNEFLPEEYRYIDLRAVRVPINDFYLYNGREVPKWSVLQSEVTKQWRKDMKEFVEEHKNEKVRIWSGEHGSWWRSNRRGYTYDINQAGIYDVEDAWDAVSHVDISKQINFKLVNETIRN